MKIQEDKLIEFYSKVLPNFNEQKFNKDILNNKPINHIYGKRRTGTTHTILLYALYDAMFNKTPSITFISSFNHQSTKELFNESNRILYNIYECSDLHNEYFILNQSKSQIQFHNDSVIKFFKISEDIDNYIRGYGNKPIKLILDESYLYDNEYIIKDKLRKLSLLTNLRVIYGN